MACNSLSTAAFVAPQQVLPLVVKRFQEALVSLSAAHQLVSALHTLSHCLRPMLLVGGPSLPVGPAPLSQDWNKQVKSEAVAGGREGGREQEDGFTRNLI